MNRLCAWRPHQRRLLIVASALAVVGSLLLLPAPSMAQGIDLGASTEGPLEVLADDGIEWQQDLKRFVARGNAVATRGEVTIRANELVAFYRDGPGSADGGTDIYRLEAHGNVTVTSPDQKATGEQAIYEVDSGEVVLIGSPATLISRQDTLTAPRVVYDSRAGIAVASGGATVVRPDNRVLRAETLTAHMREVDGRTEVSSVEAVGDVVITTAKETARGSQGNYDAKTGIATLTGSVKIVQGENVLDGAKAVVNLETGVSTLYSGEDGGRARAVLVPGQSTR